MAVKGVVPYGLNMGFINAFEGENELRLLLSRELSIGLKELLETKHLYQKVEVDPRPAVEDVKKRVFGGEEAGFIRRADALVRLERFAPAYEQVIGRDGSGTVRPLLTLVLKM